MKHIKQFGSFSKLYENSGQKTTEGVIANYKKDENSGFIIFNRPIIHRNRR